MGWLEGRRALVTGGASGIGRAVVERFVQEGATVAVLDASEEHLGALRKDLPGVVTIVGDVSSLEDNERAVQAMVAANGGLDTFVGNAGIFDYFAPVATTPGALLAGSFDEIFAVNVKGYLLGVKASLPALLDSSSPSVVFTLSNGAFLPAGGGAIYTASKHAAVGLIRQLAYELAPRVRVNGVAPGGTLTDLRGARSLGQADTALNDVPNFPDLVRATNPLGIVQQPADHTGSYVLLASPENAAAITGAIINSDGGMQVRGLAQVAGGTDLR
jgi:cis-3,4-dihydrophenanthrene-3,4-diol dehydrogenase